MAIATVSANANRDYEITDSLATDTLMQALAQAESDKLIAEAQAEIDKAVADKQAAIDEATAGAFERIFPETLVPSTTGEETRLSAADIDDFFKLPAGDASSNFASEMFQTKAEEDHATLPGAQQKSGNALRGRTSNSADEPEYIHPGERIVNGISEVFENWDDPTPITREDFDKLAGEKKKVTAKDLREAGIYEEHKDEEVYDVLVEDATADGYKVYHRYVIVDGVASTVADVSEEEAHGPTEQCNCECNCESIHSAKARFIATLAQQDADKSNLKVDGELVTRDSPLYKRLATSPVRREILDKMIDSKQEYAWKKVDLEFELNVREAAVKAARDLAQKNANGKMSFPRKGDPLISTQHCACWSNCDPNDPYNDEFGPTLFIYFVRTDDAPTFADAIKALFDENTHLTVECKYAVVIAYVKAFLDTLGEERFNAYVEGLEREHGKKLAVDGSNPHMYLPQRSVKPDLLPGEWCHVLNPDHLPGHDAWANENVIYLGNGLFWGHPFGVSSLDDIIRKLARYTTPDGKRPFLDAATVVPVCEDWRHSAERYYKLRKPKDTNDN